MGGGCIFMCLHAYTCFYEVFFYVQNFGVLFSALYKWSFIIIIILVVMINIVKDKDRGFF